MAISYSTMRVLERILNKNFPKQKNFDNHELKIIFEEFINNREKYEDAGSVYTNANKGHKIFRAFVEYCFYRNIANYDSMVLLTSDKGTGKSSFAIMMAREWCKIVGIKFNPERHIAYSNQQVQDKIQNLNYFEPLICLTGDSKVLIRRNKRIKEVPIKDLVGKDDYEVKSYDPKKDKFEWVKPDRTVENGVSDDVYEIELENGKKIKATSEHKFYTNNGIKMLKDLTENDELIADPEIYGFQNINKCKECGKEYKKIVGNKKFCSKVCAKKNMYRKFSEYTRKKRIENVKPRNCKVCGREFKPLDGNIRICSDICKTIEPKIYKYNFLRRKYHQSKKEDPNYRIAKSMRANISHSLKTKGSKKESKTVEYLGCSIHKLKNYLEKQFEKGMDWSNYGEWHIDHIKPINSYDLTNEKELKECFNYKNLQPLWKIDNLSKGWKI